MMRVVHPDVASSGNGASVHSAAEVNEAYRVLVDPARRLAYDRQRRESGSEVPPTFPTDDDDDVSDHLAYQRPAPPATDRRVPWRGVLIVVMAGVVGVVVLSAVADPSVPRAPDGVLQPGSCVGVEPNGDAREVACTGVDDLVMDVLVPFDVACPQGTVGHRDRQGMGVACVAPSPNRVSP
jgi:molecular chaperone DnaJ